MRLAAKLVEVVDDLQLDLGGVSVLTEAATGAYAVTPVLAALAGARVHALTKDTRFGTIADVTEQTRSLAASVGVDSDRITILDGLPANVVRQVDVITNSGHLRPLNKDVMQHARSDVIVPLMFEAWELRPGDLDLEYLQSRGIRVVATNERHPDVDVFSYLGELAVRQIHQAGVALTRNTFVLYANNPFGPFLAKALSGLCRELIVVDDRNERSAYRDLEITWFASCAEFREHLPRRDVAGIVLAAYPFHEEWIGPSGLVDSAALQQLLPGAVLFRFAGHVDEAELSRLGVGFFPAHVDRGHMGSLLNELGPDPVIRLQAGGLKAAEVAIKGGTTYRGTPILEWL